jgi:hypothetical protein
LDEIVFIGAVVLFALFGPWVLVWRGRLKRKHERAEDQERWRYLSDRVLGLEAAVHELKSAAARSSLQEAPAKPAAPPPPVPESVRPRAPERIPQPTDAAAPPSPVTSAEVAAAEAWLRANPPPSTRPSETTPVPRFTPPGPPPAPAFHQEAAPSLVDRFRSALDIEEALGTNRLNKLGIAILVLGVAFFLAYQLKNLGPAGKVLVGVVVSAIAGNRPLVRKK